MTDTAPTPQAVPTAPVIDYDQLAAALARQQAQTAPPEAPAAAGDTAAPAVAETNQFAVGNLVKLEETTPYDGDTVRYGIVIATYPNEGSGARSAVAWFTDASGPLGDELLTAV